MCPLQASYKPQFLHGPAATNSSVLSDSSQLLAVYSQVVFLRLDLGTGMGISSKLLFTKLTCHNFNVNLQLSATGCDIWGYTSAPQVILECTNHGVGT